MASQLSSIYPLVRCIVAHFNLLLEVVSLPSLQQVVSMESSWDSYPYGISLALVECPEIQHTQHLESMEAYEEVLCKAMDANVKIVHMENEGLES